jgi:hypothetical protein
MIETASRMEVFQLVAAVAGLVIGVWGLSTAIADAQQTRPGEAARLVAFGHIRRQLTRIAVHALLVAGGVFSVLLAPPPPLNDSEQSVILHVILVIVTAILTLDHAADRRLRYVFMNHPEFRRRRGD